MADRKQMKQNKSKKAAAAQPPKRVSRKDLKRRRIIKRVLSFFALIAVIATAFYFAMEMLFVVKEINVSGSNIFTAEEITGFIAIPEEENIFRTDAEEIENRIEEEFTYIESAKVIKRLPERIEIIITDSTESYYTVQEDIYKIYSQNFKYLRNSSEPPVGTIWIDTDISDEEKMSTVKQLVELFRKYEMTEVTKISCSEDNVIGAVYADRFEIDFGTMLDIDYKIKMCRKVLEEKIDTEEKGTIDATAGGEIVYKRQ